MERQEVALREPSKDLHGIKPQGERGMTYSVCLQWNGQAKCLHPDERHYSGEAVPKKEVPINRFIF
jgi:hypothetical protein